MNTARRSLSVPAALVYGFTVLCLLTGRPATAQPASFSVSVPSIDQVGAANLTDEIAPVTAPFPTKEFVKPLFRDEVIDVSRNGAVPGDTITAVVQSALEKLSAEGGGTVVIPPGEWHTGRISLMDNTCLHISEGATLYFSGEIEDYLPVVFTRHEGVEVMSLGALIYADGKTNIAVTGKGKLVGPRWTARYENRCQPRGSWKTLFRRIRP